MHVNNRLYEQVKEQVDSMRCRLAAGRLKKLGVTVCCEVKTVEWKIENVPDSVKHGFRSLCAIT